MQNLNDIFLALFGFVATYLMSKPPDSNDTGTPGHQSGGGG